MTRFEPEALQQRYAFVEEVPSAFVPDLVAIDAGTLAERFRGLAAWRMALLEGAEPPTDWPAPEIGDPARNTLRKLALGRFLAGQEELVDAFLADMLGAFGRRASALAGRVAKRLRELEGLERDRARKEEGRLARQERRQARAEEQRALDAETREAARATVAAEIRAELQGAAEDDLVQSWEPRVRAWAAIADVFGDLGRFLGRGWDLSLGVLRHTGWRELLRLRELVEKLPQVTEIIRTLGRLEQSLVEDLSIAETIFGPVRRLDEELRMVATPGIPGEMRGIERSAEISRMLPTESSLLGHPRLRLLWHARRAERALLTYRMEGIELERTLVERWSEEEQEVRRPKLERGPILAIIDTSGSMHGLPEQVAKAIVLEAVRVAHAEKRRCFLYSYSGPGQIRERELDVGPDGVGRLLEFLGMSFGGGNDEAGVLSRVLQRMREARWAKADVLFVSDGEWPPPTGAVMTELAEARSAGARFHGVQIGNRGTTGLHAVCDPVHAFGDWATLGGW